MGRYTYNLDAALPGKHTLKLYGIPPWEEVRILTQARAGHTHLEYLAMHVTIPARLWMDWRAAASVWE